MSKFSERFKLLRKQHNLSQQDLANQLGYTKSRVNMYERGEREPSYEVLEEIADYFNVDLDYLHGKSDIPNRNEWLKTINAAAGREAENMCSSNIVKSRRVELGLTMKDIADYVGVSEGTVSRWESGNIANMKRSRINKLAEILQLSPLALLGIEIETAPDNIIQMPGVSSIPVLGNIACGTPILAEENREGDVDLPEHIRADFALRCKGDSMKNARIYDGDIVYIRQQDTVEHGEIAAVLIGTEAMLKRVNYYPEKNTMILKAENAKYDDLIYSGEELNDVRILGKAVAFTSTVR